MALSFRYFISYIQIFNTLSETIMSLSPALVDDILLQNIFVMVESICVRGPTLARRLVMATDREPSTWFPRE